MRSSTSSSDAAIDQSRADDRIPGKRWSVTWLSTVLFTVGLIGGTEAFWRSRGHQPSVAESAQLWTYHRGQVYGERTVALLGQSRMHIDFSTETFRRRYPRHRVVQLAVNGHTPIATLRDLANDERFTGLVICALTSRSLRAVSREDQQKFVDAYHVLTPVSRLTMMLDKISIARLQASLVAVNPQRNLRNTLLGLLRRKPLDQPYFETMKFDRSVSADFSKIDVVAYRRACTEEWPNPLPPLGSGQRPLPDDWLREASAVEPMVAQLHRRGARVVFVHFPMTDELLAHHEEFFPRRLYWDRFAKQSRAAVIHFQDVPSLAGFDCPDMSHIDQRDTPRFTNALVDELVGRGLLEPADN